MQKVLRLSQSVSRFKPAQLGRKFNYRLKKFFFEKKILSSGKAVFDSPTPLDFLPAHTTPFQLQGMKFTLLNRSKDFKDEINWNFTGFGKMWNHALNSFDYLNNEKTGKEDGMMVIHSFMENARRNRTFFDSHSISKRIINTIKFCSRHGIDDRSVNEFIYYQCLYLKKNPEFHLRNNHLLENGFAILFAALYFRQYSFFDFAERLLQNNIPRQILPDGAHFELSPMYHLLMLQRMLESVHLLKTSPFQADRLLAVLKKHLPKMLGWIHQMQLTNGSLPGFNDSADGYGPCLRSIMCMASALNTDMAVVTLKESGFRKLRNRNFEMIVDVNGLSPSEAPGHSHADTFHFVLNVFGDPFIVDTGVSTYTPGKERLYERSTMAHNTVVVGNISQSEVYSSFNVGRRAKVIHLDERVNEIEATHDGYAHKGILHTRKIVLKSDYIEIHDKISSKRTGKPVTGTAFFHVDRKSGLKRKDDRFISRFTTIDFSNHTSISLHEGWHAPSFGVRNPCYVIGASFQNEFVTRIKVNKQG